MVFRRKPGFTNIDALVSLRKGSTPFLLSIRLPLMHPRSGMQCNLHCMITLLTLHDFMQGGGSRALRLDAFLAAALTSGEQARGVGHKEPEAVNA